LRAFFSAVPKDNFSGSRAACRAPYGGSGSGEKRASRPASPLGPGVIDTELGEVVVGPMLERSGDSPYQDLAQAIANASMTGSPSTLIPG
jgi:hypothetical protein